MGYKKAWKQIKIFICEANQSVIIEPDIEPSIKGYIPGVCIHSVDETDKNKTFELYATYDEALTIADELIKFVKDNQTKEDEEKLIQILQIVNESPFAWLHRDSNEAEEIMLILNQTKEDDT